MMVRQVSRMSTEGEAAPAADAPAEGEPLPEVGGIADPHLRQLRCQILCYLHLLMFLLNENP